MNNHWRWNLQVEILGIPGEVILPFALCIYIPSWAFFWFMVFMVIVYAVLNKFGITPSSVFERIKHKLRGDVITSRPFWYRKRFERNN